MANYGQHADLLSAARHVQRPPYYNYHSAMQQNAFDMPSRKLFQGLIV